MTQIPGIPDNTETYWDAMPSEVRLILRRKLLEMGSFPFMNEVGRHFQDGAWSITPFPGDTTAFARLGLREAKGITKKLEAWHG